MKHYRVNKVTKPGGTIIKRRDILASSDKQAIETAADHEDCPICDVWSEGKKVGSIV